MEHGPTNNATGTKQCCLTLVSRLAPCAQRSDQYGMHESAPQAPGPQLVADARTRDLGLAVLVAESLERAYEPVGVVATLREALETCIADYVGRVHAVADGTECLCPSAYVLWAPDDEGRYREVHRIDAEGFSIAEFS